MARIRNTHSKPNKQVHVWVFPNPEWVCLPLAHAASGRDGLGLERGCLGEGVGRNVALCLPTPHLSSACPLSFPSVRGRGTVAVVSPWQAHFLEPCWFRGRTDVLGAESVQVTGFTAEDEGQRVVRTEAAHRLRVGEA